jgi:hypothetical protein
MDVAHQFETTENEREKEHTAMTLTISLTKSVDSTWSSLKLLKKGAKGSGQHHRGGPSYRVQRERPIYKWTTPIVLSFSKSISLTANMLPE